MIVLEQSMEVTMKDVIDLAIDSFYRWSEAFNSRNIYGMLQEMHFPHYRLSGRNDVKIWETSDEHQIMLEDDTQKLIDENWAKTTTTEMSAVQFSDKKVHLTFLQTRRHPDGTPYNSFQTLWIFIEVNGKWGVKIRSSFLDNSLSDSNLF